MQEHGIFILAKFDLMMKAMLTGVIQSMVQIISSFVLYSQWKGSEKGGRPFRFQ